MANVKPLRREDLPQYEDLFKTYEQQMGFVPNSFFTMARRPEVLEGFRSLILAVWKTGTVDPQLKPLVALMASYGAGCRYCQAHEVARSHETGVSLDKISQIHDFERSNLYTEAERGALRLALAAGQHPNSATRQHFEELRRYYDEGQIVEIVAVIAAFGFLNRWNETMATDLEPEPFALAQRTLTGLDWDPGRHAPAESTE
jgi:alkylhydroperoxidase family enzyme